MIYRKALTSELSNTAGGAFTVLFSIVVTIGLVRILNQTAGGRYDTGSILEVVAYTSLINLPALISWRLLLALKYTCRCSERFHQPVNERIKIPSIDRHQAVEKEGSQHSDRNIHVQSRT